MKRYAFLALLALAIFIVLRWKLISLKRMDWRDSSEQNRTGYFFLTFVFIGMAVLALNGALSG